MANRATLLLVLAALAVGGAIGYGLGSETGGEVPLLPDRTSAGSPGNPTPPGGPDETPVEPVATGRPERSPIPPPGEGTITGVVRTLDGRPVVGALVRASLRLNMPPPPRVQSGVPPDRDLSEWASELVAAERRRRDTRRDAVTDADGAYMVHGLSRAEYSLKAYRAGYTIVRAGAKWKFEPGSTCDFVARPQLVVDAKVVLPDGSAASSARIECQSGGAKFPCLWRPDDRLLLLSPGTWSLKVTAGPFSRFEAKVEITLAEGDPPGAVTLATTSRVGISGRILDRPPDAGSPKVGLRPLAPDEDPTTAVLEKPGAKVRVRWAQRSSRNGEDHYGLFGLPDGRWLVVLQMDREVVDTAVVELAGQAVERDLTIPPDDPADFLLVRIEGPDGRPVEAYASTYYETPQGGAYGGPRPIPGRDGSYRVHHPKSDRPLPSGGRYSVEANCSRFGRKRVYYAGPSVSRVTVRFEAPVWMEVRLGGYAHSRYEGRTRLRFCRIQGEDRIAAETPSLRSLGNDGESRCGPLQPGSYELAINVRTEPHYQFPVAIVPVSLTSGTTKVPVTLPKLCYLTILEPEAGKVYALHAKRAQRTLKVRPRGGKLMFGPLPVGDYEVRMDQKVMTVTLGADVETRFVPE